MEQGASSTASIKQCLHQNKGPPPHACAYGTHRILIWHWGKMLNVYESQIWGGGPRRIMQINSTTIHVFVMCAMFVNTWLHIYDTQVVTVAQTPGMSDSFSS